MNNKCASKKAADPDAAGLEIGDFRRIPMSGFNESTRTSQAVEWFEDHLFVGTGRAPLGFMGRYTAKQGERGLYDQNDRGSERPDTGAREEDGAQLWRFDPANDDWRLVYDSPLVEGRDGRIRARDRSVRASAVVQTEADDAPALYLGVGSLERQVVFLRSADGVTFEECRDHGFGLGDVDVPSCRTIVGLNGRLYSTPTGKNFGRGMFDDNLTDHPIVFESRDPLNGEWLPACEPGFGDPNNLSINEMAILDGRLYAATVNKRRGFQLWKTDASGRPPYRWTKILDDGAWRGPVSSIPSTVYVYNGALYIGATLQRQGRGGMDKLGPFAAEMLRVYPDDSWEMVCGTPRFTPHGIKRPTTGLLGGMGDRFTHAFWRMTEYRGWMYVGTAGWKWMPTYLWGRQDLSEAQLSYLRDETRKRIEGEFSIWRTQDGDNWFPVTRTGIPGANPNNYGIRELLGTPVGLLVVPTSKLAASMGGGLELWLGTKNRS